MTDCFLFEKKKRKWLSTILFDPICHFPNCLSAEFEIRFTRNNISIFTNHNAKLDWKWNRLPKSLRLTDFDSVGHSITLDLVQAIRIAIPIYFNNSRWISAKRKTSQLRSKVEIGHSERDFLHQFKRAPVIDHQCRLFSLSNVICATPEIGFGWGYFLHNIISNHSILIDHFQAKINGLL